jgi:hypothetical protein
MHIHGAPPAQRSMRVNHGDVPFAKPVECRVGRTADKTIEQARPLMHARLKESEICQVPPVRGH